MVHPVIDRAFKVSGAVDVLRKKFAVRPAAVIIGHHIAAVAEFRADAGGLFGVCRNILHLFDTGLDRLHFDFSGGDVLHSFHRFNDTPFLSLIKILYHKTGGIATVL